MIERSKTRLACLFVLVISVQAQAGGLAPIDAIVLEGDLIPAIGSVTAINNLAINNSGSWFVEVDTDVPNTDEDAVLLRDGAVYLREGFGGLSGPPGAVIDAFDSVTLNNSGDGGFNFFLEPFPLGEDSGIYMNTDLVIQEGTISTAPQFTPGTPYLGFFDVKISDSGTLMSVASIDDANLPSSVDRAIMLIDPNPLTENAIAIEGDVLPGQVEPVADFGTGPHQSAINASNSVMFFADLAGDTNTDGVVYLNDTLLAQEGTPSPVAGRDYQFLTSRGMDLNDNEEHVFKANLDGDTADDDLLIKNSAVFIREGDPAPGMPAFSLTGFGTGSGPVQIDDNGNVLWFGDWDDADTDIDTGLFLNDTLLVQEGVSTWNGMLVESISSGEDAFFISDNGRWIIFEATLENSFSGAFLVQVPEPASGVMILLAGLTLMRMRGRSS